MGARGDVPRWAWMGGAALIVAALATRLIGLGAVPLAPDEARNALDALDAVDGLGWPSHTDSPALLSGQALLFLLAGAETFAARLIPAVAGIGMVLLPLAWRRHLRRAGILAASIGLLTSPLVLWSSRRASGTSIAFLAAGLLFTGVLRSLDRRAEDRITDLCVTLGVGLGLISAPVFFDLLLAGLVTAVLAMGRTLKTRLRHWIRPALWGVGLALLVALAGGLRWNGWAGIGEPAAAWLRAWRTPGQAGARPGMLLLYEPALLGLTILGVGWALARQETATLVMAVWGGLTLALVALRGSDDPAALGAVVLPWAWVAGAVVRDGARGIEAPQFRWVGLHTLLALILWIPVFLGLAQHTRAGFYGEQPGFLIVIGAIVLIAMQLLVAFLFATTLPASLLWRGALSGAVLALLLLQVSFALGLSFVRPAAPDEPAVIAASSPHLEALRHQVDQIGMLRMARRDELEVAILDRDPALTAVLRWVLRDFGRLRVVAAWPVDFEGILLTPEQFLLSEVTTLESEALQNWRGMRFVAIVRGEGRVPPCQRLFPPYCPETVRWYLYRESGESPIKTLVILWRDLSS